MPIYEYEPCGRDCLICKGRLEIIQGINDPPLKYCPYCGLEIKRIISRANFSLSKEATPDQAAKRGFTTFKKVDQGRWEKLAGEGPSVIEKGANVDRERIEATPDHDLLSDED